MEKSSTVNIFTSLVLNSGHTFVCPCKLTTTIWRLRDILSIFWGLPWIPGNLGFHDLQRWCVNVGLDPIWQILLNSVKKGRRRGGKNLICFCLQASTYHLSFTEKPKSAKKNGKKLICFGYLLADNACTLVYEPSPPRPSVLHLSNLFVIVQSRRF